MMTDTHTTTQGAQQPSDRLERPLEGRVVAGVAEGLSRRLGIATGWVRLGFVLAALFGGSGILAYIVGWLLMPDERDNESVAQRYTGNIGDWSSWVGIALIGTAGLIIIDRTGLISGELLFAGVLIAVGVLLYRGQLGNRPPETPQPSGTGSVVSDPPPTSDAPEPAEPDGDGSGDSDVVGSAAAGEEDDPEFENPEFSENDRIDAEDGGGQIPPPPAPVARRSREPRAPRPPREPNHLGRFTIAAALLVIGGIAAFDASSNTDVAYGVYLASFMIVIGAGLLVGSWVGRARWLVIPGLILLPVFLAVSVLPGRLSGEIGERDISGIQVIQAGGSEEMAIGEFFIDLRDIPTGTDADLVLELGIGHLLIIVPDDRAVAVDTEVGMGEIVITDRSPGARPFETSEGGIGIDESRVFGVGEPELSIKAELGIGQLEVVRRDAARFADLPDFDCEPTSPDWPFEGELVCVERTR